MSDPIRTRSSIKVGDTEYTISAVADRIREYLLKHKQYSKVVYSFTKEPYGTFLFNPLEDPLMVDFFNLMPEDFPELVKMAILNQIREYTGFHDSKIIETASKEIHVVITEAIEIKMGEWNASYEGTPVMVKCQVAGANEQETYVKSAKAYCWKCQSAQLVSELERLPSCFNSKCERFKKPMDIDKFSIKSGDTRAILIQEPMNEAKHGTPKIFPCIIKDEAVHTTFIGQHKKIIGVFRSHQQEGKNTGKIIIHAISVQDIDTDIKQLPEPNEIERFERLAEQEDYLDIITKSFAPEILGSDLAKLSVIFSIIGGTRVGRLRGEIHSLLVSNPGGGKSKIIEYITEVVQNAGFAVGGQMTGTGITVSMDTLPNRQRIIRGGIIPMCSGSTVGLDELNQVEPEDQGKIFECMESGKIHYNKGGFTQELIAETTICAACNPKNYYYDFALTISDNVKLLPPLMERFDLKVNLSNPSQTIDEERKLRHILKIRGEESALEQHIETNKLLTTNDLYLLFNYAKTFKPKMSKKAEELIINFYKTMQNLDTEEGNIRINTRFFESIIRLSTAFAKLKFAKSITEEHAMLSIEIFKQTLRSFGMNTEKDGVVLPLERTAENADQAFVQCWRKLEKETDSKFISEKLVIDTLFKDYSKFKTFATIEKIQKYFDKLYNVGKITKEGGLYKLL